MIEYWDLEKFISKQADLYNYINPFFNLNYLKSHNFFYIMYALDKYKSYFDNIYINVDSNIRLDVHQRIAILTNSKSELIIAGAGSGKTTTIAAKIKYLVDILKIDPASILLLSYTNEAVMEMKRIIVDKFKINVSILTFHKFAILLLDNVKNIKEVIEFKELKKKYSFKQKLILYVFLYLFYNLTISDIRKCNNKFIQAFNDFQKDFQKYYYEKLRLKKSIRSYIFKYSSDRLLRNYIDQFITFDSLIYNAYKLDDYKLKFKYLLIDEYQDISNMRFDFIKKYVSINDCFLTCVGDDWQTIFSFASSNISNILNFKTSLFDTQILKIINTYRNSQELLNIVGEFIMVNKYQIKKKLKSNKHLVNPIELISYKNKKEEIEKISNIIEQIKNKKIAILTRYKKDINMIIDNDIFKIIDDKLIYKNEKEIYFYTVHASKGLGFDYVFLINNQRGYYGFPPRRKNNSFFVQEDDIFEERRLYYVALTRTKNKVYLVYNKRKQSVFLKEMKKMLKNIFNLL